MQNSYAAKCVVAVMARNIVKRLFACQKDRKNLELRENCRIAGLTRGCCTVDPVIVIVFRPER